MELVKGYLELRVLNEISKLIREIYLRESNSPYEEYTDLVSAVDHLFYWRVIPDDLYEIINELVRENDATNIHNIYGQLLEINGN